MKILAAGGAVRLPFPRLAPIARIRRWTRHEATGEVSWHTMFYLTSRKPRKLRPGVRSDDPRALGARVMSDQCGHPLPRTAVPPDFERLAADRLYMRPMPGKGFRQLRARPVAWASVSLARPSQ